MNNNQCIECYFLESEIKSIVVSIHNSLEDIGFHHILQDIDFDALPDGDEFEAILGDWLKQFSPEFPVSPRLFPEAMSRGTPPVPPSPLTSSPNPVIVLRTLKPNLLPPHLCSCLSIEFYRLFL